MNWIKKLQEGDASLAEIRGKVFVNQFQYDAFKEAGFDMSHIILMPPFHLT